MRIDLSDISFEQARSDEKIALNRVIELSCRIDIASQELLKLREQMSLHEKRSYDAELSQAQGVGHRTLASRFSVKNLPVHLREFAPWLQKLYPRKLSFHIDSVGGSAYGGARVIQVSRSENEFIAISGWVVPKRSGEGVSKVELSLINGSKVYSSSGFTSFREDVAKHFSNPKFIRSGFQVTFATKDVPAGRYSLHMSATVSKNVFKQRLLSVIIKP